MNSKLCKLNFNSENKTEMNEILDKIVQGVREEISNGLETSDIDRGNDIVIIEKDLTLTITTNSNQRNEINTKTNVTSLDLGECESKLKTEYKIPKDASIYILKMEVQQPGYKIPKIEYEAFYPLYNDTKLYLLNMSLCNELNIDIYLPLSFNGSIDILNPNSAFYNDICITYKSENGTDLTLEERKKNYVNKNLSVCEENCDFIGYNKSTEKVICSCKTKSDFVTQVSEIILRNYK